MKINLKKQILSYLLSFILISPAFALAQPTGTNPPNTNSGGGIVYECSTGLPGECTFDDLIKAAKHITDFLTVFALEFSVVVIAFAGFKYMTSGGNPGERQAANKMLLSVAKGIFFILAAWVIVTLITSTLLSNDVNKLVPLG